MLKKILNLIDSLLTRQRVVAYSGAILLTVVLIFALAIIIGEIDTRDLNRGDFSAFYTAGLIVKDSGSEESTGLYDLDKQTEIQKEYRMIEDGQTTRIFLNPPLFAWLMVPFSKMPYVLALNIWRLINIMIALFSVILITKQLKLDFNWWEIFVILIASYAGFSVIFLAQNSFIFLAIYAVSFFFLIKGNNFSAGLILGLGALKPQLFLFLPVVLFFQKKWDALTGFALSSITIAVASYLLIGYEGILEYFNLLSTNVYLYGIHGQVHKMHSFPALTRLILGIEINAGYLAIFSFLFMTLVLGYLSIRKGYKLDIPGLLSLAILVSILSAPHLFHYDLALLLLPFLVIYSWTKENTLDYTQARNYRLALLTLYVYLWLSHFIIDIIQIQVSVLLMIYLVAVILKNGTSAEAYG